MHKPPISFTHTAITKLADGDKTVSERLYQDHRAARILGHYEAEVSKGHMGFWAAIDRAIGDILGQNRAEGREQRK